MRQTTGLCPNPCSSVCIYMLQNGEGPAQRDLTREAPVGIEPTNRGFADLCLTTWLRRRWKRNLATHCEFGKSWGSNRLLGVTCGGGRRRHGFTPAPPSPAGLLSACSAPAPPPPRAPGA